MYLRPYQAQAIQAKYDYFAANTGNPIVAMPTGTGKSVVQAGFLKRVLTSAPGQRILCLTHVKELIEQNAIRCRQLWPTAPVGIHSAGLSQRDYHNSIIFGGIQSAITNPHMFGHRDLILIDECQLISPSDGTQYRQFLDVMQQINPGVKAIGYTATPFRMGQGMLTDPPVKPGESRLFTDICYDITGVEPFNQLIADAYLCPLVPKKTQSVIDVSQVRVQGGDYVLSQLAHEIEKQKIIASALLEARELAADRKSWLVFAAGIKNCEEITTMLNNMGISATQVHSKIPNTKKNPSRDNRIKSFKAGRFRALVVNNIGTVGFDHPAIDCIIDLRPTTSVVLHIQKYGRGTRPYFHPAYDFEMLKLLANRQQAMRDSGKLDCLILDFAGNVQRLGPINDPRVPKPKGPGTGDIPIKLCPQCGAYNHTPARFCCNTQCDYEFIFKTKVNRGASTLEIIKKPEPKTKLFKVSNVAAKIHEKKNGKAPLMKVVYFSGNNMFNAYLGFLDRTGLPRMKGVRWWRQHHAEDTPATAAEALAKFKECRTAAWVKVNLSGEYPEIMEYLF